jgi:hypothetical protein
MKYNVGDIIPFEQIQEATDYVNSIDGNYYLDDYQEDEQGRMMLIVRQLPPYVETVDEIKKRLTDGVQNYMDATVQTRGYDNIHTACTYVSSTDEVFKAEGTACLAWRDSVWRTCYNILDEVKAGKRAIPTLEEVIAELPVLVW